ARADRDPAELGEGQHFRGRVPHQPRPHEDPGSGAAGSREEHVPRASQEPEQRDRAEAEERKSSPPDRDGGRENGAEADVPDEVESERKPETRDDEGAPFHGIGSVRGARALYAFGRMTRRASRARAGTAR